MFPVSNIVIILFIMFLVYFILLSGDDLKDGIGIGTPKKILDNILESYKYVFQNDNFKANKSHKWYVMTVSLLVFLSNAMTILFVSYFVYTINQIIRSDVSMETAVSAYNTYIQANYTYLFGYTALKLIHGITTTYAYSISTTDESVRAIKYTSDLWLGNTDDILRDIFMKWSALIATVIAKPIIITIISVFLQFIKNKV